MGDLTGKKQEQRGSGSRAGGSGFRPVLIGTTVVAMVLGALVVAENGRERIAPPTEPVTAGGISVEGEPLLPARVPADAEADSDEAPTVPVRVYELMGQSGTSKAPASEQVQVRTLPLPPPAAKKDSDTPSAAAESKQAAEGPDTAPKPEAERVAAREAPAPTETATAQEKDAAAEDASLPYTLQVASFSRRDGADKMVERLSRGGYRAYLVKVDLDKKGVWWRVRVGRYPTEHAAKWARLDLVRDGLRPIVVHDSTPATP